MEIKVKIALDTASPLLSKLAAGARRKAELNEAMGNRVQSLTRDHLVAYGLGHPNKLGGRRTNYWGRAAQDVMAPEVMSITDANATMTLSTPGITRAFQDIIVRPGTKTPGVKYLALPARAEAYGLKPREIPGLVLFWFGKGKPGGLAEGVPVTRTHDTKRGKAGSTYLTPGLVMFWFAKQATQPQDRSLLPSDEAWSQAASTGAADFVQKLRQEATTAAQQQGGAKP
jgi:hypothetical protein